MTGNGTTHGPPLTLPAEAHAAEEDLRAFWTEARRFYRTGRGGGIGGAGLVPALLARFRDAGTLRYAYPLWIADPAPTLAVPLTRPLAELLEHAVTAFAAEPSAARALRDNLARIELAVRTHMADTTGLVAFRGVVEGAVQQVVDELALPGQEGEALAADATSLLAHLPADGSLLALSREAPLRLFEAVARAVHRARTHAFTRDVADVTRRIRDRLDVENAKSAGARDPGRLASSFGGGRGFIDADALAGILPRDSASEALPPARLERLLEALRELDAFDENDEGSDPIVVRSEGRADGERDAFADAVDRFDTGMRSLARLIAALQVGRLELRGEYDASVHDEYYADFDWRNFTAEEAALAPPVVVAVAESRLEDAGFQALTRMLFTGRPLKMIVLRTAPDAGPEGDDQPFRHELEHLAVAQPETFVLQASAVDAVHMAAGYERALATPRPAVLHVFTSGGHGTADDAGGFLAAGAALDSRDFPLFEYDPNDSHGWSTRFSIAGNPQPESEWPVHALRVADAAGAQSDLELAFTFADHAAARPEWSGRFLVVPPPDWCAEMVPLADYLRLTPAEAAETMPYIWMADGSGRLHRVICTHDVVLACRDRLNHWRILQELGGVRNPHAKRAADAARIEAQEEAARERQALEKEHEQELERVRRETAGEAMGRLAAVLMNMDDATLAQLPSRPPVAAEPESGEGESGDPATDGAPPPTEPAAEQEVAEEPWIASALCTSCNECIDVNPLMFRYNGDKLAYLADVTAGTYAQLVRAAEQCPARCIHPGAPLNSNEPDLDALMKRAAKFM